MEEIGLTGPQTRRVRATADDIIADPRSGAMAPDSVTRIREAMTDRCATADALVRWALAGETEDIKLVAALADLCVVTKVFRAASALVDIAADQAASRREVVDLSEEHAIVHWALGNATGHGNPMPSKTALAIVEAMNERYGAGTHWVEYP